MHRIPSLSSPILFTSFFIFSLIHAHTHTHSQSPDDTAFPPQIATLVLYSNRPNLEGSCEPGVLFPRFNYFIKKFALGSYKVEYRKAIILYDAGQWTRKQTALPHLSLPHLLPSSLLLYSSLAILLCPRNGEVGSQKPKTGVGAFLTNDSIVSVCQNGGASTA